MNIPRRKMDIWKPNTYNNLLCLKYSVCYTNFYIMLLRISRENLVEQLLQAYKIVSSSFSSCRKINSIEKESLPFLKRMDLLFHALIRNICFKICKQKVIDKRLFCIILTLNQFYNISKLRLVRYT